MATCWFCEDRRDAVAAQLKVKMRLILSSKTSTDPVFMGTRWTTTQRYQERLVTIPRCEKCKEIHSLNNVLFFLYSVIYATLIIAAGWYFWPLIKPVWISIQPAKGETSNIIVFSIGCALAACVLLVIAGLLGNWTKWLHLVLRRPKEYRTVKSQGRYHSYPEIARLTTSGWREHQG